MPDLSFKLPYPSQRQPILGESCVATSQPLAAQAGLELLRRGGTAADAAIATAAAMTVLEPTSNGIGGDNFALVWDGSRVHGLNASGRSPAALDRSMFDGEAIMPARDWRAITVPGAVSGWVAMWKKFGRLPFADLFEPAIRYARDGYPVAPLTAALWQRSIERLSSRAEWKRVFMIDGRAPKPGERIRLPDHAATLRSVADTMGESFYRGALASAIAKASAADGGVMRESDLASHVAEWVEPISAGYRGLRLWQIPPNGQGIATLMALSMLRSRGLDTLEPDCPDALHVAIEAMKLAFREAHREVADPRFMRLSPSALLDLARLDQIATSIDPSRAQDFDHGPPNRGGTILLCTADREGQMVSFIQSNYQGFGSGVVIPGTGIAMHNRGANFTLEKGHPNEVAGGKRPYHTIIPGLVTTDPESGGGPLRGVMAFGVMGGFMQPQGQVQVLLRIADHRMNPQAALDAPRWQVTEKLTVEIEPGFRPELYEDLRRRGHDLKIAADRNVSFGRGQAILRLDGPPTDPPVWCAGSDLRADGQAVAL